MLPMKCSLIVAIISLVLCGCQSREQKNDARIQTVGITEREEQLQQWEQKLQQKENELTMREVEIENSIKQMDSLNIYNPQIIGNWRMEMECIETNCEGSAIGDTKTEQWNITYANNSIVAKAYTNNKLIRTYSGRYKSNGLQLTDTASTHGTQINVSLQPIKRNRMEGAREIMQPDCKIVYSLVAERIQ